MTLSHEGIRSSLGADCRRRSVTRQHGDVVAERIEFLPDPAKQQVAVATRQIPAADSAREQDIAANQQLLFPQIKTEAAGTMSRHFQDFQLEAEEVPRRNCRDSVPAASVFICRKGSC